MRYVDSHGHIMVTFLACKPKARPNAPAITTVIFEAAEMAGAKETETDRARTAMMQGRSWGGGCHQLLGERGW